MNNVVPQRDERPPNRRKFVLLTVACLALGALLAGCDSGGEPPEIEAVMLTFRIEAETLPGEGWGYWYVHEGILYRRNAGLTYGPHGAQADCGSHAGIDVRILSGLNEPQEIELVIETVDDEPVTAREIVRGAGEHHLAVHVACP